jgi:hypothetical protein
LKGKSPRGSLRHEHVAGLGRPTARNPPAYPTAALGPRGRGAGVHSGAPARQVTPLSEES